jgi:predicted alpha/beta hydrolase
MTHVRNEEVSVRRDRTIAARFFIPPGDPKASILIAAAMGVTQAFYAPFAEWLSEQGYLVATFDYEGIGESRKGSLRKLDVTINEWAEFDCQAMIRALTNRAPGKSLYWIGHSLGGQILGLLAARTRIAKAIIVAAGSGETIGASSRNASMPISFASAPSVRRSASLNKMCRRPSLDRSARFSAFKYSICAMELRSSQLAMLAMSNANKCGGLHDMA